MQHLLVLSLTLFMGYKLPWIIHELRRNSVDITDLQNSVLSMGSRLPPSQEAAAPTFSPSSQTIAAPIAVTMSTSTPGGIVHFTDDGSLPTNASPTAPNPVTVNPGTVLRALTTADGYSDSLVSSASYPATSATYNMYYGFSPDRLLDESQVLAQLTLRNASTPYTTYSIGGDVSDYFVFWFDDAMPNPTTTSGFSFPPSSPIPMADASQGYVNGPVNGWFYKALTVNGRTGKLFASFFQLGDGSTQSVVVQ